MGCRTVSTYTYCIVYQWVGPHLSSHLYPGQPLGSPASKLCSPFPLEPMFISKDAGTVALYMLMSCRPVAWAVWTRLCVFWFSICVCLLKVRCTFVAAFGPHG